MAPTPTLPSPPPGCAGEDGAAELPALAQEDGGVSSPALASLRVSGAAGGLLWPFPV